YVIRRLVSLLVFFSSRRRHTRSKRDWSSDVCSSDLTIEPGGNGFALSTEFDRAVEACRRTGTRFLRIGMMPFSAMTSQQACEERSEERRVGKVCRGRTRPVQSQQRLRTRRVAWHWST